MLRDRYDNPISTSSSAARDAYVAGVDCLLAADPSTEATFRRAIEADEGFALAHVALARTLQQHGRGGEARAPLARARELAAGTSEREQSHIDIFGKIIEGQGAAALSATREHVKSWPRDAMALAPSTSVFGLIGFSGLPGREEAQYALLAPLAPTYGEDWWFLAQLAFSESETGRHEPAVRHIEKSMRLCPRNAHGAHIRAHVHYELGERRAGLAFLNEWAKPYPREGQMHCHVSWHLALWALEAGDAAEAWRVYREQLRPGAAWGPQINVLTDCASFLHRAALAGETVAPSLWQDLSAYALQWFPAPGIAFADMHGALAHAMAGDGEALARISEGAKGAAADVVGPLARAFGAYARGDWPVAIDGLRPLLASHERFGGSRAQRDLIEYTLAGALIRSGRSEEAGRLLASRRPRNAKEGPFPLAGLAPAGTA
jgi:tetratricopeptide (TPR) repeat protein